MKDKRQKQLGCRCDVYELPLKLYEQFAWQQGKNNVVKLLHNSIDPVVLAEKQRIIDDKTVQKQL